MIELLKDFGIAGFLFFSIKGIIWIVLFLLVYFGLINKERVKTIKANIFFWRRKKNT